MNMKRALHLLIIIVFFSSPIFSQIGRTYSDGHGGRVFFPFGDISFADEVVSYSIGNPAPLKDAADPNQVLHIPNYNEKADKNYTTLGYGGELVIKFVDNVLYDIDGYDLFILEIGPSIEPVDVYISKNGTEWISVGRTGGGLSKIDIANYVKKNDAYRFVKIIDIKDQKDGSWPGADIDAIGAIGSSLNFQLNSSVLFKTGEYTLTENKTELITIAKKIEEINGSVLVEGYTDSVGTSESNMVLSEKRAQSIKHFLVNSCNIAANKIETKAYGENNPIDNNATEEGRKKNRRVQIIISQNNNFIKGQINGRWATNWGELHLYKYGKTIAGWYDNDGGEILGTFIDDHTIEGKWVENGSEKNCNELVYDRSHWGKLIITFNTDFTEFTAKWGYCSENPTRVDLHGKIKFN
jgi:outer membrane protein OmpA-like peptidoglycan-associated protein